LDEMKRVGDLEITQDLPFQEREWRSQRIGWAVMALVVLAALLGLFGDGPLGQASAGDPAKGLGVSYARFSRFQSTTELAVRFPPESGPEVRVLLSRSFADRVTMKAIVPPPAAHEGGDDAVVYIFRPGQGQSMSSITFSYEPNSSGTLDGWVRKDSSVVPFSGWVFP